MFPHAYSIRPLKIKLYTYENHYYNTRFTFSSSDKLHIGSKEKDRKH